MTSFRSLGGSAAIYLSSNIINSAIPFFLLPFLTRFLTPEEYGTVGMFTIAVSIFAALTGLSVNGAVGVRYYQLSREDHQKYVFNCLGILVITSALMLILVWLMSHALESLLSLPYRWIQAAIIVSGCQFVVNIRLSLWQVQKKARHYGLFQVLQSGVNAGVSLLLVATLSLGWAGRTGAIVVAALCAAGVALADMLLGKDFRVQFDKKDMKDALGFGIPLLPHAIGALFTVSVDRLIVSKYLGLAEAGIYIVGLQIGMIIGMLSDSLNKAFAPWLMQWLSKIEKQDAIKVVKLTYIAFLGLFLSAALLALGLPLLLSKIAGEKYQMAKEIGVYTSFGYAFVGMYYLVTNYVFFHGKTGRLSLITLGAGTLNVMLNFILVKQNGLVGAGQAFLLSHVLTFLGTWWLASRIQPMPWFLRKV